MALVLAANGMAQRIEFSTFDQTTTAGSPQDLREAFADAKAPGNGFVYATGSIEVVDTLNNPMFSGVPVVIPAGLVGFQTGGFRRQVGILQRNVIDTGAVAANVYYHGISNFPNPEAPVGLHTNVRSISVWPGATPAATRIAICGETSDQRLPQSGILVPVNATSPGTPVYSGFIAVFNVNNLTGAFNLLWSHQLFGRDPLQHCAVTDVSIRVVGGADVVTYCGVSSHGVELVNGVPTGNNGTLMPVNWYISPNPGVTAGGASENGVGQWDGFVGRVVNAGSVVGGEVVDFHAVVGGVDQDGLFGLAELPGNRVVVVGSTASTAIPGIGALAFPFTMPNQPVGGAYCMGTALVFNAAATPGGALVLEAGSSIGTGTGVPSVNTIACDVFVHLGGVVGNLGANPPVAPSEAIHIVGSTNDAAMFGSLASGGIVPVTQPLLNTTGVGPNTDGYLLSARDVPLIPLVVFQNGTYHGGTGNDTLHGVAGWNEHRDHVAVFGGTTGIGAPLGSVDLELCNYFLNTPVGVPTTVADPLRVRRQSVPATQNQEPTAMGQFNALVGGAPAWDEHGLGSPAGGGVCVEERGRVTGVGRSPATATYPVGPIPPARPSLGGDDAVRTDIDMLPVGILATNGVGRTDGTGLPTVIPVAANGGTTPAGMIAPFGLQVGVQAPALLRMNIDFEGLLPTMGGGGNANILVDRPGFAAPIVAAFIQYGVPTNPMTLYPDPTFSGIEWWVDPFSMFTTSVSQTQVPGFDRSVRFPLVFPPGNNVYVIQAICMLAGGGFSGSPGMVINY
ncbi:MAG: hypothetical protein U1E73_12465 [Planctomycetota bacterium]